MTLYLIILVGMTGQVGYNGSRIAVSLYALESGASQLTVGILIALYAVFPMLLAILVGKFVDRVGSWLPVLLGIGGMALALVLPPLFPGVAVLFVTGAILGLAHLLFIIPIEASIGGIGGPEKRASNYAALSMGWSIANFCGPIVAGFSIDRLGHLPAFWVLASFYVLPLLILWLKPGLVPKAPKHAAKGGHGSVLELWRIPNMRTIFITGAVIHSAQNLFQFYFPIYGHSLGISASAIGIIMGVVAAAAFVIRGFIPLLMKKWTEAQVLTHAVFVGAIAFVLLPFVSNTYALAAIAFLFGLGVGSSNPLSMSLLYFLTPPARIAESVGMLRTMYNVTQLVVPVFFGSVGAAFGFSTVFISNAAMLVGGGLLMRKARLGGADRRPK